jgi:phage terminase large subunit-like protein
MQKHRFTIDRVISKRAIYTIPSKKRPRNKKEKRKCHWDNGAYWTYLRNEYGSLKMNPRMFKFEWV